MTSTPNELIVIKPGWLIDGQGGPPIQGHAVTIQGDRIAWCGPAEQTDDPSGPVLGPDGSPSPQVLDLQTATLLPGLIDCHTHTNMPGDGRRGEDVISDSDDVRLLRSAKNVERALVSGVTTLCDAGSWNRTAFSLKEGIRQGLVAGPRVMVAGQPVTVTGGHLWYMGGEADGPEEVRQRVRTLIKEGADFIKVIASGGSTVTSDPYRPSLTVEELKVATSEAHGRNRPVSAHCRSTVAINNALDAGVDVIFHCAFYEPDQSYRYDQATAERLAEGTTWVNPTLYLGTFRRTQLRAKRERGELNGEEVVMLERLEGNARYREDQFGRLVEMGVKFVGGSDCGWGSYPFGDFQGELLALNNMGLSPMHSILAGTRDAATAMRVSDNTGTIETGKAADLLLVEGNPVEEIAALRRVLAVFHEGSWAAGSKLT